MMRSESEVDAMIEDLKSRTKGKYITQACSFNKTCPRQMGLLKKALMESVSFSGLVKEMLALRVDDIAQPKMTYGNMNQGISDNVVQFEVPIEKPKVRNVGNFI